MLIAAAHVLGSVVALVVFGLAVLALGEWERERNQKAAAIETSIAIGVPPDQLDDPRYRAQLIRFAAERFSPELFRNRISDLCGLVSTAWAWLGNAVQALVLGAVVWFSFSNPKVAVNAWWVVAIAICFWLVSVIFALVCKLLTGRYPGQAKQARKALAQLVALKSQAAT